MKFPFLPLFLFGLILTKELNISKHEDDDLTLTWNSPTPMDLSRLHMTCLNTEDPDKLLIYLANGVQKYQDEQFSGRVQCDTDALRRGEVRVTLTNLTPLDSGKYKCDMAANPQNGLWDFITTERFVLQVLPEDLPFSSTPQTDSENSQKPFVQMSKKHDAGAASAIVIGVLVAAPAFMVTVMFAMRQFYH